MANGQSFWLNVAALWSEYGPSFLRGAGMTMLIAVISTALGCVSALPSASCRPSRPTGASTRCAAP